SPRVRECQRDGDCIQQHGQLVLGLVTERSRQAGSPAMQCNQGAGENVVGDSREQQDDSVYRRRPCREMVFADPCGGEWHQREPEQKVQVRPKHGAVYPLDRLKEVVVVAPVNPEIDETQHVAEKYRKPSQQTCRVTACRQSQFQHHDGDGNGDDAIAESCQPSRSHGLPRLSFVHLPMACAELQYASSFCSGASSPSRTMVPWVPLRNAATTAFT